MYSENSTAARFRALFATPALLTAVIAFTAQIVLNLLISIFAKSITANMLSSMLGSSLNSSEMRAAMSLVSGGSVVSTIIALLPAIFVCTALWLVYVNAKKPNGAYAIMNPIGFKLINIYDIICMVLMILATVLVGLGFVIALFGAGSVMSRLGGSSGGYIALLVIGMVLALAILILDIVFFNKARKLAKQLANAAATGNVQVEMGSYLTVICWILGVVMALGTLGSFLGGIFVIARSAANATAVIAFAIFLGKLRTGLQALGSESAEENLSMNYAMDEEPPYTTQPGAAPTFPMPAPAPDLGPTVPNQLAATAPLSRAILLRQKTGENIRINTQSFTLGRNPQVANYVISDNPKVSGNHAAILTMSGIYYLVDNNSTNHTYVNNAMIQPGVKVPLSNQSVIKLCDEVFIFLIP